MGGLRLPCRGQSMVIAQDEQREIKSDERLDLGVTANRRWRSPAPRVSPAWPGGVRDATRGRRRERGGTEAVRTRERHGAPPGREPPGQAAQVAEERGAGVSQSGGLAGEASRVASPRRRRL